MQPILFSIAGIPVFSLGFFLVVAWLVFSFIFWKLLYRVGVEEKRIFDLTFYATLAALIVSRVTFVFVHPSLFSGSWLKVAAIWVQPGFSLYGGLVGGIATVVYLSRKYKVRLAFVLDAWALAFPVALMFGKIGSLLDATEVGREVQVPWAISYGGHVGTRHPVQFYEIGVLLFLLIISIILGRRAVREKWPYGLVGVWFFLLFSIFMFIIEFMKESVVYAMRLNLNQWILVAMFAESIGAFYVRGGGRETLRPTLRRLGGALYAKIKRTHNP
ncbi:prolipoprotein diacylglyceryl transferase [Candidatus Gottesmanbacteria bacterium]|nr:prolipoprotein diacylglyceryl transferase [Candidatus Gottesmanbacteria bacterium]